MVGWLWCCGERSSFGHFDWGVVVARCCCGALWLWRVVVVARCGCGALLLWRVVVVARCGCGALWLWW